METKKKTINVQTQKGLLTGEVVIKLNMGSEKFKFTHSVTHDDVEKMIAIHQVVAVIDGKEIPSLSSQIFSGKDNIMFHANAVEKVLTTYLLARGNSNHESLDDRLKQNGYV